MVTLKGLLLGDANVAIFSRNQQPSPLYVM
jgi:hypothetical protein